MTPYEEKLFEAVINNTLNVLRYGADRRAAMLKRLNELAKQMAGRLATEPLSLQDKRRLGKFIKGVEELIDDSFKAAQLSLDLPALSETVATHTGNSIKTALGVEAINLPLIDYFKSVASEVMFEGAPSKAWWEGQAVSLKKRFAAEVRKGLMSAETNQQIIARIVGTRTKPGVMETTRRGAAALVQTSVQAVANDARLQTFKSSNAVIGVMQVSTLDAHTSDICMAYSGAKWKLDGTPIDNSPAFNGGPPRHFNCRSVLVPITKSLKDLGLSLPDFKPTTRASDVGQISAATTFDEFLRRKPAGYADAMLGKGRADLWRSGKITLRDLVSGDGSPLTLDELRRASGFASKAKPSSPKPFVSGKDLETRDILVNLSAKPKIEHLLAYDEETLSFVGPPTKGSKSGVSFGDKLKGLIADPKKSIVVHHTHPSSSSLSPADVLQFDGTRPGMRALWAHGLNGSSYKAEIGLKPLAKYHVDGLVKTINGRFNHLLAMGEPISVDDINLVYFHVVNLALHKQGRLKYSYELGGEHMKAAERLKSYIDDLLKDLSE